MKKIAVVCESMKMGGTEIALLALLKKLLTEGHSITLYMVSKEGPLLKQLDPRVEVKYIPFKNKFHKYFVGASYSKGIAGVYQKIICKLYRTWYKLFDQKVYEVILNATCEEKERFDVILDAFGYGRFVTAFAATKLSGDYKATWFHDENVWWLEKTKSYFDKFDSLVCVSNSVKAVLDSRYPEGKAKSIVVHNLIDCERIKKLATEQADVNYDNRTINLLTIGRLTEQKGIDIAIEIAELLCNRGIKFKWYVIGDGEDRDKLDMAISMKKLGYCFKLLGMKTNPYPYLKKCDIYVQPSRYEGYGLTILEARVLNKPIVATQLDCFSEQIKSGENGILVKLDKYAFADAIATIINDERIKNKLEQNLKCEKVNFDEDYEVLKKEVLRDV